MMRELFTPEIWSAFSYVAALLLAVACLADALRLFQVRGQWGPLAAVARIGALVTLVTVLVWVAIVGSSLSLLPVAMQSPHLQFVALALATLILYLVLAWRLRVDAALVVDLVALAVVLAGILALGAEGLLPSCAQRWTPFLFRWLLFLAGAGGLMVAGSAGLTLALHAALSGQAPHLQWWPKIDLHALLKSATAVALVALGGGLTLSLWWWQATGTYPSSDPREGWIAVAWLVGGMSMLVRRAGRRWGRWTTGLAILAAATVILGLLIGANLDAFLGT